MLKKIITALLIALGFLLPWVTNSNYLLFELTMVWVYTVFIFGLNLLTGFNGQISLGHTAFYALGAYICAILCKDFGLNYLATFPIAAMAGFFAGFIFGYPMRKLNFLYLVLATLALGLSVPQLIKRMATWTGGTQGIILDPFSVPQFIHLNWSSWSYLYTFTIMLFCFWLLRNMTKGRYGRAINAVRDNDIAARAMGVNIGMTRAITFAFSAAFAALSGAMLTTITQFIAPDIFDFSFSIFIFIALIVGGVANFRGAIVGALFLQFVPPMAAELYPGAPMVIFAIILLFMAYFMPNGVIMGARKMKNRILEFYYDLWYHHKF